MTSKAEMLKEFEAPFKDKLFLYSTHGLVEALIRHGISKSKAIVLVDNVVNHHEVILRAVSIPNLTFRQIHRQKTHNKPDLHLLMPKGDYKKLKLFFKQMQSISLFTLTTNQDKVASLLGWANDFLQKREQKEKP